MPAQSRFTVAFSDVVVPKRLYSGGRFIGFSEHEFEPPPRKSFASEMAYNRYRINILNQVKYIQNLYDGDYVEQLERLGCNHYHDKSEIPNLLRFGEAWCEKNLPPRMQRGARGELVPAPFLDWPHDHQEDEDSRVTGQLGRSEM